MRINIFGHEFEFIIRCTLCLLGDTIVNYIILEDSYGTLDWQWLKWFSDMFEDINKDEFINNVHKAHILSL